MSRWLRRLALACLQLVNVAIAVRRYRQHRATEEVMVRGDVNAL